MNSLAGLHIVHTTFFAALSLDNYNHFADFTDADVIFQDEIVISLGCVNDYHGRIVMRILSFRGILYAYEETFKSSTTLIGEEFLPCSTT